MFVHLSDIIRDDINFMGKLKISPDDLVRIRLSKQSLPYAKRECVDKFNKKYKNKKVSIRELISDRVINHPEWRLNSYGQLVSEECIWIKEKIKFVTVYRIDIRHKLKELSPNELREVGEIAFQHLRNSNREELVSKFISNVNKGKELK